MIAPPTKATGAVAGPSDTRDVEESGSRSLASHVSVSLVASLAVQGLNVFSGILGARLLGPSGKGEVAAILLWPGLLVAIGYLGMSPAITYFAAREPGREKLVFGTSLIVAFVQAVVLMVIGYLLLPLTLGHYGDTVLATGRLYLWWIPVNLLAIYATSLLTGRLRFIAFNAVRVALVVATVLGLFGLWLASAVTVATVVLVTLGANVIALALALFFCARAGWIGFRVDGGLLRAMLRYGLKSHTAGVASLVNERGDLMMISLFLSSAQLGLYSIALSLASPIFLVGASVATVTMPAVAEMDDRTAMKQRLGRFVRATVLLSSLAGAALFVVVPVLIELFFGSAFAPATDAARLLLVAGVVLSTNVALGGGLRGLGSPLAPGLAEGLATAVTVVALAVLLPALGLLGAALASLLAYGSSLVCMVAFLRYRLGVSVIDLLMPRWSDVQWAINLGHARLSGLLAAARR